MSARSRTPASKRRRRSTKRGSARATSFGFEPRWYQDAVIYQLHVKAFHDFDGDGLGDFRGLTEKLDYVQDLGVTAIWLLPFYPSPLKDDGYDTACYTEVHPQYGDLADFQDFLERAHSRGLRVITELVLNHTSDQHEWFQRARRAPRGSKERDFYVWSDTGEEYQDARIIFQDFEQSNWSWDPVAEQYYWHRFYHHQPDLNYDNPAVRKAMFGVMDYWFDLGVDGLRLDAVPYLHEAEGTNCENLPETHGYLKELRSHVDEKYGDRMFLAEANQWPEDAVEYFGDGDECHVCFNFPVMPRLFMGVRMEDRHPIIDILNQTPEIPDGCQWATFLRNHDELTLEMVTDEERDYMYRAYAHDRKARINLGIRRRLAPLLGNERRRIELMNALLFSLPGTPIVYYGDEIGMGDNFYLGDRDGVRTPMQWSDDRNAGFSAAPPQSLYLPTIIEPEYHYEKVNVRTQESNPSSLLWWMRRLIAVRKRHPAFSRGSVEFLTPENSKVLAFVRRHEGEKILVVANLSRFVQAVELDLSEHEGDRPRELFGQTPFPAIGELPYFVTLGPHSFYWFQLEAPETEARITESARLPTIRVRHDWEEVFEGKGKADLQRALPGFLATRRWFAGKARTVQGCTLVQTVPATRPSDGDPLLFALVRVDYTDGEPETYSLLLGVEEVRAGGEASEDALRGAIVSVTEVESERELVLHDAFHRREASQVLLSTIEARRKVKGSDGVLTARTTRRFKTLRGEGVLEAHAVRAEQSNTSIIYGDRLVLKLYRKLEPGTNPDLELSRFLTETAKFPHSPPLAAWLDVERGRDEAITLGLLQGYVPNQGDAWSSTLDSVRRFLERVVSVSGGERELAVPRAPESVFAVRDGDDASDLRELLGSSLDSAELLGRRTGEMHAALASDRETKDFKPEPFSTLYQRSLYQSMRSSTARTLSALAKQQRRLAAPDRALAREVVAVEPQLLARFQRLVGGKLQAQRIRTHGDYHLGQVLGTGSDFVIIDFEGEPARPLSERRLKRSPLRDVAGMLRSYHYATEAALRQELLSGLVRPEDDQRLRPWLRHWHEWTCAAFLAGWLEVLEDHPVVPKRREDLEVLLEAFTLEKAIYELSYELGSRPDWVGIPLRGILDVLESPGE